MIQYIEKSRIKIENKFRVRSGLNSSIASSIRKNGILSPVIVLEDLTLLDGFSRFNYFPDGKLPVIVKNDRKEAFFLSIELNMLSNPYSEFEKARAIKIAFEEFKIEKEEIVKRLNPLLKFSKKISIVEDCLNIFNLDETLFALIESKKSPISFALRLLKENVEDQRFLADLFKSKRLSLSRMQIVYDLMYYIRKRDSLNFRQIIEKCKDADMVSCLNELRFPGFVQLKEELNGILKKYKGNLSFPEDLEAGYYNFYARISSKQDIDNVEEILEKLKNDKEAWNFLKKVRGDD